MAFLWIKQAAGDLFCDTEAEVRRLVIRPGAIGDLIVSLPALECLRGDYLEVWVATVNIPLVRFANRVRGIVSTGLDLLSVTEPPPQLLDTLRGFDSIVSWYGANRPEFRDLTQSLGLPFTFFRALPPEGSLEHQGMHATDFYLDQVRAIARCQSDGIPHIACRIDCPEEPGDFAVIHPFSGSARKNWPLEKFRSVARNLERLMPVHWCSGPEDPLLTCPTGEAVHIADLYELACWLSRARLYIGNDSGITHLAAAVGTPVLALFGPTDPEVWGPRGTHVRVARWHTA